VGFAGVGQPVQELSRRWRQYSLSAKRASSAALKRSSQKSRG
jgi:hypothetical protein